MTKKALNYTIYHKLRGGEEVQVPSFEDEVTGEIVASSAYRQPIKGAKIHGGHCNQCNKELDPETRESWNGICDECNPDIKEAIE